MIVMFLFYNDEQAMAALSQQERNALVERHIRYHQEYLAGRVEVLATRALEPTTSAVTVRPSDGGFDVTDGPFARPAEAFAGFYLVDCRDMAEAIELVKAYPMPQGLGCIEVRPAMRVWDYAPSLDIPVPPERIWRWYADLGSWPRWKVGVAAAELDGPLRTGATGRLTPSDQPPMPFRIVSATENEGYVSETEIARDLVLRLEHILTPLPGGATRAIHRATIPRGALDVFGINFSPHFNAGIRATLKSLSAIAQDDGVCRAG